jgi:hypothetical protein
MRWRDFWRGGGIVVVLLDLGVFLVFERVVVEFVGMMGMMVGDVIL